MYHEAIFLRDAEKHEKLKMLLSFPFPFNVCKGAAVLNSWCRGKTTSILLIFVFGMNMWWEVHFAITELGDVTIIVMGVVSSTC